HHPRFQALEASWRGLDYLIDQSAGVENVKIRVLAVSWREIARDLERAIEFDQSQLFRKVYSEEFGTPGGEPFGVLLGDYEVAHRPRAGSGIDDVTVLKGVAAVAAAAFAPFIAAVHPSLFGLDSFADLERSFDIARVFQSADYVRWNSLREIDDSRFLGLTLPRVLIRRPWRDDPRRSDGFRFHEETSQADGSGRLWTNACYAFGAVLLRSFAQSGWLASIRGAERGIEGGGLITGLVAASASTDEPGIVPLPATEVVITDMLEKALADMGFAAVSTLAGTSYGAFYSTPSIQQPRAMDQAEAKVNAKLSAMLPYILCTSRFAHAIKMIGRDRQGSFIDAEGLQTYISTWIRDFVINDDDASSEMQARKPLREASVSVRDVPGKPGAYYSVIHLRPHFQLDDMSTSLKLVTEIVADR
ncbi:MAG: type VI secretion system contractile sheath large subunit, partial [Planctomycetota bacterium]